MGVGLTVERVRRDAEVLARAGLDVVTFLDEIDESLRRAVPYTGMCVSLYDPATALPTATFKFGALAACDTHDLQWCEIEFNADDPTSFRSVARRRAKTVAVHLDTQGDVASSVRMRDFMTRHFGFVDELRTVVAVDGRDWGAVAMLRDGAHSPFAEGDVEFVASLSSTLAAGMRVGLLGRCAASPVSTESFGPAVLIVRRDNSIGQVNAGAEHWLAELAGCDNSNGPIHTLAALVDGARRYARGETSVLPHSRVRAPSGRWLVLHGSPLSGAGDAPGDVVVTIEEARPPEIVPLIVAAFELTPRERDVTQLVLQGVETKDIAAQLCMSAFTVQDHLKSVFEKARVRSRRELVARVFFDQYLPRMGEELAPSGWLTEPAKAAARHRRQRRVRRGVGRRPSP